eukprot:TRINITY_DN5893_c0_g1_i4.p1 TRINITY_DN5893_c0_g1~~TRINITY_DN5893_c0_g1_i4.p1  ORF type:complete len:335 (-),score=104.04 TRINITY_DN5893_c0_g1_i4:30-1034(-)
MIRILTPKYKEWHKLPEQQVVIMKGAGEKAFCAGGDIVAIYHSGKEKKDGKGDGEAARNFFYEEYVLNHLIATLPSAQVSILNGITMGGGVGLSVHGRFRVATESTVFAMPETGIGFFCDVGGSHFLPRLPSSLGMYLALTGARLKGSEVFSSNIATHYVPSSQIPALEAALHDLQDVRPDKVGQVLKRFHTEPAAAPIAEDSVLQYKDAIHKIFSGESVDVIIHRLEALGKGEGREAEWAKRTLAVLHKMSPTSLRVVFDQIRRGSSLDIAQCLQMEYRMAQAFMDGNDFFEGVRALLVDKDKNPRWAAVPSRDEVDKYFILSPGGKDLKLSS